LQILTNDPDPREKWNTGKPVKMFTDMASAKAEAESIANTL
jgi:hypothetical protein